MAAIWTTRLFPLAALLIAIVAWTAPSPFVASKPAIVPLLCLVMFGMGMTLRWSDFRAVAGESKPIALGVGLQFLVMPLAALGLAKAFGLGPWETLGAVLVGTCPGGTASNVITYLARGRVAMSITMTLASTALAVLLTPWLTWLYAGHEVPVPVVGLFLGVFKIVVAPVLLGLVLHTLLPKAIERLEPVWPMISVAAIVVIIGIVVGLNADRISAVGFGIIAVVVLHNTVGLVAGYAGGRLLRAGEGASRTVSIEVGLQNSGLAAALVAAVFPEHPEAMVPAALFSVWQNVAGSLLAGYWGSRSTDVAETPAEQPGDSPAA